MTPVIKKPTTHPMNQEALAADKVTGKTSLSLENLLTYSSILALAAIAASLVSIFLSGFAGWQPLISNEFLLFVGVGFVAQLIDGALGMAYGISSTSFLLGMGVPPVVASASVHVAEVFTTGVSGLSHLKLGNVNRRLFQRLVLPGVLGVAAGAYVLTTIDSNLIKPVIAVYLLVMGIVIIRKSFRKAPETKEVKNLALLAVTGGFMDAVGGGGWGPIVASSLLSRGVSPRYTIGSVNTAEFFVAVVGAGTFISLTGLDNWRVIAGLIVGGVLAAPLAAFACKFAKPRILMLIVGVVVIALSIRTLWLAV